MILNVNKQEVSDLLDALDPVNPKEMKRYNNLKEKLKRLQITSEPVKSTIEQVQTAE